MLKLPGAVIREEADKAFDLGIRHPSPSFNWIFGNTNLIPYGTSVILWGGSKGGKSIILNGLIGQMHRDDPEAVAIKFNTEFRETIQTTPLQRKIWGIDDSRYLAFETNIPDEIFDFIETKVLELIQGGVKVKLIAIDSISDIQGRRSINATTINTQQRGDEAATIKDGLKRIKSVVKRNGITLVLVAQERAEQDELELMRGKKTKMAGATYLKHFAEYFVHVAKDESKDGRVDLLGNKLEIDLKDLNDKNEQIAHKVKFRMQDSTVGPKGRMGEFTLHYYKGVINSHEEVFQLAKNRKIVSMPNNRSYVVTDFPNKGEDAKWGSKEDFLNAIKDNSQLSEELLRRLREKDIAAMKEGVIEDLTGAVESEGLFDDQESSE